VGNYVMPKNEQGNGFLLDREDYERAQEPEEMKKWARVTRPSSARGDASLGRAMAESEPLFQARPALHANRSS
jgi:hypothetical protein